MPLRGEGLVKVAVGYAEELIGKEQNITRGVWRSVAYEEKKVRKAVVISGDWTVLKETNFRVLLRSHLTGHSLEGFAVKLPKEVMKMIMEY
ncbi:hypothetical protein VNO78_12219 [Psophocarpus tetragonolobus]|uniref:Uncharacterized protein n=1 Tax=Psophocarpus tetragonolobus TaxID=3891 RepID=A0AAN9SML4_PSOTE